MLCEGSGDLELGSSGPRVSCEVIKTKEIKESRLPKRAATRAGAPSGSSGNSVVDGSCMGGI